jgi:hypothetical protein
VLFFPEDGEGREGSAEDQAGSFCGDTGGRAGGGGRGGGRIRRLPLQQQGRSQGLGVGGRMDSAHPGAAVPLREGFQTLLGAAWRELCESIYQPLLLSCLFLL